MTREEAEIIRERVLKSGVSYQEAIQGLDRYLKICKAAVRVECPHCKHRFIPKGKIDEGQG